MPYQQGPMTPQVRFGSGWTPVIKYFVIACVATFVVQQFWPDMTKYFGLVPALFWQKMFFWQPATFNFLHGGLMHIFFNMFVIYMFGPELERLYGRARFIGFLIVTGIGAGICSAIASPAAIIPTIGASGIVFGVMLLYAINFPNRQVLLMFVIPIKIKWLMIGLGVLEFWYFLGGGQPGISNIAHLGGMGFGYLYIRYDKKFFRIRDLYYRRKLKKLRKKYKVYDGGKDDDDKPGYVN